MSKPSDKTRTPNELSPRDEGNATSPAPGEPNGGKTAAEPADKRGDKKQRRKGKKTLRQRAAQRFPMLHKWKHGAGKVIGLLREMGSHKHRFVITDAQTFKEKIAFELSIVNIFTAAGLSAILLVVLTSVIIVFTPLREFIPGYFKSNMVEQTYHNAEVIDSLESQVRYQEWMISAIQEVLSGRAMMSADEAKHIADSMTTQGLSASAYTHSRADSLLRLYVEQNDNKYQVKATPQPTTGGNAAAADAFASFRGLFFPPVQGQVINEFDPQTHHYGIDVASITNVPITCIYSGTVLFANFTVETGYIIAVQHPGNVISVYKHCNTPLKQEGDVVQTGEPLAYLGNTGHYTSGPHLHFELWMAGTAVNPLQFITL